MFVEDERKGRKLSIDLEDKINDYIDWCSRNYSSEYVSGAKKFIDDMVEWYEEPYLKNVESFISSHEVNYLKRPMYYTQKKFKLVKDGLHEFSLTSDGRVRDHGKSQFELYDNDGNLHKFNDVKVEDLVDWLEDKNFRVLLDDIYYLYVVIEKYKCDSIFRAVLLDTVMYKLIERGGSLTGTLRGSNFANQFDRDTSIPLQYGIADMNNRAVKELLIRDYLSDGGDINLECYVGYFNNDKNNIYTKKLFDIMSELGMNPEEAQEVARKRI